MMRWVARVSTEVLGTVTAPPLPGGQVMVTLTLVLGMVPAGKPVPVTVTLSPTLAAAGEVLALRVIAAEANEDVAAKSASTGATDKRRRTANIHTPPKTDVVKWRPPEAIARF